MHERLCALTLPNRRLRAQIVLGGWVRRLLAGFLQLALGAQGPLGPHP